MSSTILDVLLESSIRACVVAALVGGVLAIVRLHTGAVRHAAWVAVLFAMLAMPWLPRLVPSVAVSVPSLPAFQNVVDRPLVDARPSLSGASASTPTPIRDLPRVGTTPVKVTVAARLTPEFAIVLVYAAGVVLLFTHLIAGVLGLRRFRAASQTLSIEGVTVLVHASANVAVPLTTGILRPRIVLPSDWNTWPADKLAAVLAHEQAHVERRDPLVLWLARVNRCLFWFNPLVWWLERELARTAEQACDTAAVRAAGHARRYAEVLVEMAEAVRNRQGRLVSHGIGIDGVGSLSRRIDRILSGEAIRPVSRARKFTVATLCTLAIAVGIACQQAQVPAPLAEDPEVAERLARQKADNELWAASRQMTVEEVNAAEAALDANPEDFTTRKKLLHFYQQSGPKVLGWNEMVERRRPRLLWVIEHHPEDNLATWRGLSARYDPKGYAEAKRLWTAHVARPDASSRVLYNAATFFQASEKPTSEALLLRARTIDPNGPQPRRQNGFLYSDWNHRLGTLYALAILGSDDDTLGNVPKSLSASEANNPFATAVRRKLDASIEPEILYAAGLYLTQNASQTKVAFDHKALGRTYLERAAALKLDLARTLLESLDERDRALADRTLLRAKQAELLGGSIADKIRANQRGVMTRDDWRAMNEVEPKAMAAMTDEYRFRQVATYADGAYMWAEALAYTDKDMEGAAAAYARSKQYAEDALAVATKFTSHPLHASVVHRATIALAAHALREGDREQAVDYMNEAATIIPSGASELGSLQSRLVNYLLDAGERESVAAYLERVAPGFPASRDRMLADAVAIRAGLMPMGYQHMKAPR